MLKVIGVGPGDPGCLTLAARGAIETADILFVPKAAIKSESLALDIVRAFLPGGIRVHELVYPMTRDKGVLEEFWARAGETVSAGMRQYEKTVFLTLGDPSVYSTWTYLRRALMASGHSQAEWEIIPGITSFSYAAALLKEELAIGKENFCVIPMPQDLRSLQACVEMFETVVLMKIGTKWPRLRGWLKELGLEKKTRVVCRGGLDRQIVAPLLKLPPGSEEYLGLAVVGGRHQE